nr:helix-turn-helix domain-containing protein [Peribacillus butanolivorans]
MTIKELAELYNVSDRSIHNNILNLLNAPFISFS